MSLLHRAQETYDSHICYTENRKGMTPMAPVGHIVTRADWEITIDTDGRFVIANTVDKTEPKMVMPASEESAGRTSAPCAHPLCEQLGYLLPQNKTKYQLYIEQLTQWESSACSHRKLLPILQYVRGGTIVEDLMKCGLIKQGANGIADEEKRMIRWRIQGEQPEECWLDPSLFRAYTEYELTNSKRAIGLCMVTGKQVGVANQHPKGVFPLSGNAKLVSANDLSGFTYRGRFVEEWQAAQIGYETSQKAHNALRWLIQEQGVICGKRVILCWNPQGKSVTQPTLPFRPAKTIWQPANYQKELRDALESRRRGFQVTDGVVVAAFEAATTGRLAVTYYNEFQAHDFLRRLYDWDDTCCWPNWKYGIQPPSLWKIVNCAFGTQKSEKGVSKMSADDLVLQQQIQRLVACRVEKTMIGADIEKALVIKASQPQAFEPDVWEDILFTACAVIRKYRYDRFKEEWKMALEPEKKDRSYQYGRMLAVMEKIERDTYDNNEGREPNAMRMQSVFCQRPMYAAGILEKQLEQAYFPKLKAGLRMWYKAILSQIMEMISQEPQEKWNLPLEDSYLMGYYLQRNALYTKNNKDMEENSNEYSEE